MVIEASDTILNKLFRLLITAFKVFVKCLLIAGLILGIIAILYQGRNVILKNVLNWHLRDSPLKISSITLDFNKTQYPLIAIDHVELRYQRDSQAYTLLLEQTKVLLDDQILSPQITHFKSQQAHLSASQLTSLSLFEVFNIGIDIRSHLLKPSLNQQAQPLETLSVKSLAITLNDPDPLLLKGHINWQRDTLGINEFQVSLKTHQPTEPDSPHPDLVSLEYSYTSPQTPDSQMTRVFDFKRRNSFLKLDTEMTFSVQGEDLKGILPNPFLAPEDSLQGRVTFHNPAQVWKTAGDSPDSNQLITLSTWQGHIKHTTLDANLNDITTLPLFDDLLAGLSWQNITYSGELQLAESPEGWQLQTTSAGALSAKNQLETAQGPLNLLSNIKLPQGMTLTLSPTLTLQTLESQAPLQISLANSPQLNILLQLSQLSWTKEPKLDFKTQMSLSGYHQTRRLLPITGQFSLSVGENRILQSQLEAKSAPFLTLALEGQYRQAQQQGVLSGDIHIFKGTHLMDHLLDNPDIWLPTKLDHLLMTTPSLPRPFTINIAYPWQYWPPRFDVKAAKLKHEYHELKTATDN